ncbi:MAG: hypothetical protein RIE73_13370 [Coleofasciculus sp. C1-SOL-03]
MPSSTWWESTQQICDNSSMLHYRKSTLIDAPVEVVWNFHSALA